jgi:hypothetical protein
VAWEARTGLRQTQTCSDTPATARLRRDLHAHRCKYCESNLGRASYYCKSDKQSGEDELILSTLVDPLSPHIHITQTLSNESQTPSYSASALQSGRDAHCDETEPEQPLRAPLSRVEHSTSWNWNKLALLTGTETFCTRKSPSFDEKKNK